MRACFLISAICGCTGGGEAAGQVCGPGRPSVDAAVYAGLTATSWFDSGGCGPTGDPLPPTCNRLQLGGDGRYTWTAFSDAPERMQSGSWNFRARDATSGVVCLDDGSVVDFALTPTGGLRWGQLGQLSAETPARPGAGRARLPAIAVDPLFVDLTTHAWAKTNEMDLYRQPSSFALRNDGTFDATFRDGACTASGTFSVIRDQVSTGSRLMLWTSPEPNVCDTRNGGTPAFALGDVLHLEDGVLFAAGASYRDATITTDERSLAISSYSGEAGLTVSATWNGALRANAPTAWAIALRNDGKAPQAVASLRLDLTPAVMTSNGLMAAGPAVTVADRALSSMIPPGDTLSLPDVVAFTPGPAGWMMLHLDIGSSDSSQAYRNQGYFFVELP